MVIGHVLSSFELGGQERIALDLVRQQQKNGKRTVVVSLAPGPHGPLAKQFAEASASVRSVPKHHGFDPTLIPRLAACLSREGVDVVHTHNPQALVYGAPAGKLARASVLHTKHGVNPDPRRRQILRRVAAAFVDAYVAVTPALAALAAKNFECAADALYVVENGIDVEAFRRSEEARAAVRRELGIAEDAFVIGTVGRLSQEKNQALLIRALAPALGPKLELVLVGDGPEHQALVGLARSTHRSTRIHFTRARSDVARLLSAFDVFALTSSTEGLPLVLLEAMACELPVVATRVGGIPDLVEEGTLGLLVPAADDHALAEAVRALAADRGRALMMGTAGRQRVVERHSLERMAREYHALYVEILERRRLARMGALSGAWAP